jgi:RHS repeat-associated protein
MDARALFVAAISFTVALVLDGSASAQDYLGPTIDIQSALEDFDTLHPDIVVKANELQTPLRIFQFVRDEIEHELYFGSKKGALGTLWSGRGNDLDQASLLIGLLRARGFKARYVIGVVDVPMAQAMTWADAPNPLAAHNGFFAAYCWGRYDAPACATGRFVFNPTNNTSIRMEHAWVEVESKAAYRGLAVGEGDLIWIPLDPSWKQKDYQEGIADIPVGDELPDGSCPSGVLCFPYDDYYAQIDPRLPSEIWEQQIREWLAANQPGKTLADIPYDGPIKPLGLEVLPLSLPFDPVSSFPLIHTHDLGALSELPPVAIPRRYRMIVGVERASSSTVPNQPGFRVWLPELVHRRATVVFYPDTNAALAAEMQVGGYLAGPFGGSPNLIAWCLDGHSTRDECQTRPFLRVEGYYDAGYSSRLSLGDSAGAELLMERDLIPGISQVALGGDFTEYPVTIGSHLALAIDASHVSDRQIRERIDRLLALREQFVIVQEDATHNNNNGVEGEILIDQGAPGIQQCPDYSAPTAPSTCDYAVSAHLGYAERIVGELLHLVGLRYFQRLSDETSNLKAIDRIGGVDAPSVGLAKTGPVIEYLFDHPVSVHGSAPVIDIRGFSPGMFDIDCATPCSFEDGLALVHREGKLLLHVASALEHQVWEEMVGRQFMSTVKGFQIVRERFPETDLLRVDETNAPSLSSILQGFPFDRVSSSTAINQILVAPSNGGYSLTPMAQAIGEAAAAEVFYGEYEDPVVQGVVHFKMGVVFDGEVSEGGVAFGLDLFEPDLFWPDPFDLNLIGSESFLAYDPVSMVSGNNYLEEVDLTLGTHGPPLTFVRAYNSQSDLLGELGYGWTHTYEQRIARPLEEQEFVHLPDTLANFADQAEVRGVLSDTGDTWNMGTSSTERLTWSGLPTTFTQKVTVDGLRLQLAYLGQDFTFEVRQGGQVVHGPVNVPSSPTAVAVEEFDLPASVNVGSAIEIRLNGFAISDRLYFARLVVAFRGPKLERVELPLTPSSAPDWPSTSTLTDHDPSTCVAPSSSTTSLSYPAPSDTEGGFALELRATVAGAGSNPQAVLWLGSTSGVAFPLGPNDGTAAARQRFLTTNLSQLSEVSYAAGSPIIKLCEVERTLLRFREQLEFVRSDGVHERFTRVGTAWEPAPGVRDQLVDIAVGEGGPGYRIVRPDGSELEFLHSLGNGGYRLTEISDAQGRSLILTYNATTQRLEGVSEQGAPSRLLTFSYDAAGFIDQVSDWSGRVWDYTVDGNGDLREFKDPLAVQQGWPGVQYTYETGHENDELNHNLKRVTYPEDRNGDTQGDRWVEFSYFNNDKVESHTDSLGNRQTFLFNLVRLENQTTDPRGFTTVYRHDTKGNLVQRLDPDGAVWSWEYDDDRNVIRETDPFGRVRQLSNFDAKGNPGLVVDRDGKQIDLTYDSLTGAPATIVDKRGNTRTVAYTTDGLPQSALATIGGQTAPGTLLSTNSYDPTSRRVTQVTESLGDGTGRVRDTRFHYDEPGDPTDRDLSRVESRDESGSVIAQVEYDYDELGRRRFERVQRETSASDPTLIELVTETQYNGRDQVERVVRADGTVQVSTYDKNGNLKSQLLEEHRPDGQVLIHGLTQFFYDALDRLVRQVDAAGGETLYAYDASGNRVAMIDPEGHTWRTEYDAMNRPIRVIDPNGAVTETRYDLAGRVVATIDATGIATQRTYDEIGRLVAYQYGDRPAATREVFYGPGTAYREELTDPEGRLTRFEFDDLGRVFRTTDAANGVTQVAYNLLGSAQTVTDPINKQTIFTFDALGRTRTIKPYYTAAGAVETLDYDRTGNVIRRTSPDGCALDQDYDAMGRLVARFTSNEASCPRAPVDDRFGYDARGLLVAAQNESIGLIREYDALGRLLREIDTRFGTGVGYAYDQASRLTSKVYPDGSAVHYAYDGAGRTVGISDPFGDTTRFVYDGAGRRLQKLGTQGLRTEYGYDPGTGWLTGVTSYTDTNAIASAFAYGAHDDVGNRLAMTETSGASTSYGYDALNRLASVDPPDEALFPANGAETWFAYDGSGNRTDFGPKSGGAFVSPHTTYSYGPLKRLTNIKRDGATVESFTYDVNGNAVSWTPPGAAYPRALGYDALGRMVSISAGFSASYAYDPFGRRIEKTEQGVTTRTQYDGLDVVAEYSETALTATYVFGPGIDEVLKLERGTTVAAYHTDGLGSVVAISEGGTLRNTYRYDAFGKAIDQGGSSPVANAYTYTGRELDGSGLYYYRARYYLPSAGRFLTPDPIGLAGGINAYAYVGSNPVNYTDPFGLMAGRALGAAAPSLPSPLMDPYHPNLFDPSFRVETRSYAPFFSFAHIYPPYFGFFGDDRGPSADLGASSRMHGDVLVRPSSGYVGPLNAYSDLTIPSELPLPALRETPEGTLYSDRLERGVRMSINLAGSDPWYFGAAPDIDLHTIVSLSIERDTLSVDVWQFGDQFPNSDVVVRDSRGRGVVVHSFETQYGPQIGPAMLMGDNYGFMGHSSVRLPLDPRGSFRCPPVCLR